jgi:hypothetical protein
MTALLDRLAEAESPSLEPDTQSEPFAILAAELRAMDFEVQRVPGCGTGDHLEAHLPDHRGAYQLLLGPWIPSGRPERSSTCR